MSDKPFFYQDPFPLGPDTTEYECLSTEHVSVSEFEGKPMLKIAPEGLTLLAAEALKAINFMLRPAHLAQVAAILDDPEASENDRMVALMMLKNAEIAAHGILPFCQDTGTATIVGKKGQQVWTGCDDAEFLSLGIYQTYIRENLRYSQTAPLTMYDEVNTKTNLPAQIDLYATAGDAYKFLFVTKGGGSANKTYLYQETKALLNPARLKEFCLEKMKSLGTAACPPYHLAFVIGGTSAENCLKTVKLASTKYYDALPTAGNEHGQAFRDLELEKELLAMARETAIGAQFGGKYFALDVRVVRLPRHGASCPVGIGVSCSADRQAKAKITKDGIFLEKLENNPGRFIPEKYRDWKFKGVPVNLDLGMAETLKTLGKYPGDHRRRPHRNDHRRARHRPRETQGNPRTRWRSAGLLQELSGLLCRSGQDAGGHALRFLRSHHRRADGQLCRSVPIPRRLDGDARQGQPLAGRHRRLQNPRRVLPRLHRRPRRAVSPGPHQVPGSRRLPRTRHGGRLENHRREFPRLHPRR